MSLITVVRDVCAVVGVAAPTIVFAAINSNRTMFEMLACANEMAQRIADDTRDWTVLRKMHTFVGACQSGRPTVPLIRPCSICRPTTSACCSTPTCGARPSRRTPMRFVSDHDEWLQRRNAAESDGWGEWTHVRQRDPHPSRLQARARTSRFMYLEQELRDAGRRRRRPTASWPTTTPSGSTSACSSSA